MIRRCPKCNKAIDDDTQFCPYCGTNCTEKENWVCTECQTENIAEASFCKKCGASLEKQEAAKNSKKRKLQKYLRHPYTKYIIGAIVVLIIAMGGSYYYFNNMSENHYFAEYAEAAKKIEMANNVLTSNISAESLKSGNVTDIQKKLQEQKQEIDNTEKNVSQLHAILKYEAQQKNLAVLLQKESNILDKTGLVITKPLDSETDNVIKSIKDDIDAETGLADQIKIPNVTFNFNSDISVIPHQLALFVEEKRQANKDKLDQINAMTTFFQHMDSIIQRYDSAKTDFASLLGNVRSGGYTWYDYFSILNDARTLRMGLRNQVNYIKAPSGTENIKNQFSDILNKSVEYCDLMNAGARLEFNHDISKAQDKYDIAKGLNSSIQGDYTNFINNYQAEKAQLTNPNN